MHSLTRDPWFRRLLPAFVRVPLAAGLRRLGLATAVPPVTHDGGLGIDQLPDGLQRLPVGSPVALLWQNGPADALWVHALLGDALQGGPVFLLTDDPAWVDQLLKHQPLQDAHAQGHLAVWLLGTVLPRHSRHAVLHEVLAELRQVGLSEHHALFVVGSPTASFGHNVAQIQHWGNQIRNWCCSRTRPLVFGFTRCSDIEAVLSPLRSLDGVFQHMATLGAEAAKPVLFVDRWNGNDGPIFQARYGLKKVELTGRLAYDGSQARGQVQRLVEAPDQFVVVTTQDAVAGQSGVPADWQLVAHAKELQTATSTSIAATVLLHSGPAAHLDDLFRLVHQLRLNHPRTLKIVVRETHEKLRSNIEQALLHLGANKVVYRELGFSRLVHQLADMSTETYARQINPDYNSAVGGFMPDAVRGYLPAPLFCEAVQSMLDRTSRMGLKHSFLQLTMQAHVAHLDAIRACLANRDGDIMTADQNALYVFMFSCAEPDIEQALPRLFALPPSELFATQLSDSSLAGMRGMLRALRDIARKGLPDYSVYLAPRMPSGSALPAMESLAMTGPTSVGLPLSRPPVVHPGATQAEKPLTVHSRPIGRRVPGAETGDPHVH